jgi:phosphinothricin acetyltransferase
MVNLMEYELFPLSSSDREKVIDIFNYYVENSFAAYPERKVPYEFFDLFLQSTVGYPTAVAKNKSKTILGFGMLRPHSPMPTMAGTAEISYFIKPECTGKGLGSSILEYLLRGAKDKGFHSVLASISSFNEGSIRFHSHHGFFECGRFREVGKKHGKFFDVVWMQKIL